MRIISLLIIDVHFISLDSFAKLAIFPLLSKKNMLFFEKIHNS